MWNRRDFLAALAAPLSQGAEGRPNVLFLSVDDMNDWVGCLGGYPGVQTPNIDSLAMRGALFADAHCSSPICNPSRTALLTGWAAWRTGIYNNDQPWPPSLPDAVTLPQYFRRNGYYAAGAGKVFHHVAGHNPPSQWDEFQLQQFDDPWYRRAEWYPWNVKIPAPPGHPFNGLHGFQGEFDWGVIPGRKEEAYGDMAAVQYGREFLNREHGKPFFLAIGLWHPHIPMFAPQEFFDLYPPERIRLPEVPENDLDDVPDVAKKFAMARIEEHDRILREGKWRDAVRAYLACISFADRMIGYLLEALDRSAYAKNTIVVLWSDNGWHLGEKRHWHKTTLWQRSTHVPLVLAGPGVEGAGSPRHQPVSLLDLYPTLIDLCSLPKRQDLDGASLVPLLRNPSADRNPTVCTLMRGDHAVIARDWRYIRYHDGAEELYDRRGDPNEYRNLSAAADRQIVKRELAKWLPARNAAPAPERNAFDFDFARHEFRKKSP
jgi:arylsulfatase A-like enzyme